MNQSALPAGTTISLVLSPNDRTNLILGEPLGFGGTGIVYRAWYRANPDDIGYEFALKEFYPHPYNANCTRNERGEIEGRSQEDKARLSNCKESAITEFRLTQNLSSQVPHLAGSIKMADEVFIGVSTVAAKNTYIVMPKVSGLTLNEIADEAGKPADSAHPFRRGVGQRLHIDTILKIVEALLTAIGAVHSLGWVHCDLKPRNIILMGTKGTSDSVWFPFLLDLGSAHQLMKVVGPDGRASWRTAPQSKAEVTWSKGFSAPELTASDKGNAITITPAADIYSLGAILLWLMTGCFNRTEFSGDVVIDMMRRYVLNKDVLKSTSCSREKAEQVYRVLLKALSHAPEKRYQTAAEMLAAVQEISRKTYLASKVPALEGFIPRPETMNAIRNKLKEGVSPLSLWGFGGIGKTELALHYINELHKEDVPVHTGFITFNGSFRNTIIAELPNAFPSYSVLYPNGDSKTPETVYSEMLSLLKLADPTDVLVIDNVYDESKSFAELCQGDDEGRSYAALCGLGSGIRIKLIFTTRYVMEESSGVFVDELPEGTLLSLVRQVYREGSDEAILRLIRSVDRNTLAVDLIAKTLAHTHSMTPEMMLEKLQQGNFDIGNRVTSEKNRKPTAQRLGEHICTLLRIASLDETAQWVFSPMLLTKDSGIEYKLFLMGFGELKSAEQKLDELIELGWIRCLHIKDSGYKLRLHPLVRYAAQQEIHVPYGWHETFLDALELRQDFGPKLSRDECIQIAESFEIYSKNGDKEEYKKDKAYWMEPSSFRAARCYFSVGDFQQAKLLSSRAINELEKEVGSPPLCASAIYMLAGRSCVKCHANPEAANNYINAMRCLKGGYEDSCIQIHEPDGYDYFIETDENGNERLKVEARVQEAAQPISFSLLNLVEVVDCCAEYFGFVQRKGRLVRNDTLPHKMYKWALGLILSYQEKFPQYHVAQSLATSLEFAYFGAWEFVDDYSVTLCKTLIAEFNSNHQAAIRQVAQLEAKSHLEGFDRANLLLNNRVVAEPIEPKCAELERRMGYAYAYRGIRAESREHYQKALGYANQYSPTEPEEGLVKARLMAECGRTLGQASVLEQVLGYLDSEIFKYWPEPTADEKADVYCEYAKLCADSGNAAQALAFYEKALDLIDNRLKNCESYEQDMCTARWASAQIGYKALLYKIGKGDKNIIFFDIEKAVAEIEQVVNRSPYAFDHATFGEITPEVMNDLANCSLNFMRKRMAEKAQKEAHFTDEYVNQYRSILGECYLNAADVFAKAGNTERASVLFDKAIEQSAKMVRQYATIRMETLLAKATLAYALMLKNAEPKHAAVLLENAMYRYRKLMSDDKYAVAYKVAYVDAGLNYARLLKRRGHPLQGWRIEKEEVLPVQRELRALAKYT